MKGIPIEEVKEDFKSSEEIIDVGQTNAIKNEILFLGNGVYYSIEDVNDFKDRRVLVLYKDERSVDIAIALTEVTGRVILLTEFQDLSPEIPNMSKKLKRSDVKVLGESKLLEVIGEGDVEKVKILDLDEKNAYELFVDDVIIPEHVKIPKSCELTDE